MFCAECGKVVTSKDLFCAYCGAKVPLTPSASAGNQGTALNASDAKAGNRLSTPQRRKKVIWVIVSALFVLLISIAAILIYEYCHPQFEMNADGSLYFDGNGGGDTIEIPVEYNRTANSFADKSYLHFNSFSYDSSLMQFAKYYSWVFYLDYTYSTDPNPYHVYCNDYELIFETNDSGLGVYCEDTENGTRFVDAQFVVIWKSGDEKAFESLYELWDWLGL